ncbi:MAG: hypothetical protein KF681_00375 [Bdellovibrionaceae bacterium]|nr:hypothetical protein [Pseudobdellovibrionaceae bacterium]
MKLALTLLILLLIAKPAWAHDNCLQYVQLNDELGCSDQGYLINFGYRYCRRFKDTTQRFSPEGQAFLADVRTCLLHSLRTERRELRCDSIEGIAMDHHIDCYDQAGFCSLSSQDRWALFTVVWRDLVSPRTVQMAARLNQACQ